MDIEDLTKDDLFRITNKIREGVLKDMGIDPEKVNLGLYIKKKNDWGDKRFMILYQNTEFLLAKALSPPACKLMLIVRALCEYENKIPHSMLSLCKLADLSKSSGYRAMKELKEFGIIVEFKDEKDERIKVYYLNPEVAWKGKLQNKVNIEESFEIDGKFNDFKNQDVQVEQLNLFGDLTKEKKKAKKYDPRKGLPKGDDA